MPATSKKTDVLSKRTLTFVKKARKQMRKLRKATIANSQSDVLAWTERQIEVFDKIIADQKKARADRKELKKADSKK